VNDVLAEIRRILLDQAEHEGEVRPEQDLLTDLQLDSVQLLGLVVALEDRYRVVLAEEDAAGVRTVADLCDLVNRKRVVEAS
jgi:acyl carrier protein